MRDDQAIKPPRPAAPAAQVRATTDRQATCWSVIVRAQGSGEDARRALDQLIRRYQRTVVAIIRAFGVPRGRSPEDLKQEFFTQVLARDDVRKLDRTRGKFRNWLHVAVDNFMRNVWNSWHAERKGESVTAPHLFEVAHEATPESLAMRRFAEDTLLEALERHRTRAFDGKRFALLAPFLPGPQCELAPLAPLAARLGTSTNALSVQLHELRAKHQRIMHEVVAETIDVDPTTPEGAGAVEREMMALCRLLREDARREVLLEPA